MSTMTVMPVAHVRPIARQRTTSSLRLTRRGRLVVTLVALAAFMGLGFASTSVADAALHRGQATTHTVVVLPGDTLWKIAASASNGGDIRSMEHQIKDLNGLSDGVLVPGQHLRVPGL